MSDLIRKILQSIVPIRRKSIWTSNVDDLVDLFKQYFLLNQTTKEGVETFLRNSRISFEIPKYDKLMLMNPSSEQQDIGARDELFVILPGPPIWEEGEGLLSLLPYGSQYHVRFQFMANVLYKIKATLIVYHF